MDGTGQFSGTNSAMAYSGSIWQDCPVELLRDSQTTGPLGWLWEKRFDTIPITPPTTEGNWGDMAAFTDTGGTITGSTLEVGGGAVFASDGDNEGASTRTVVTPAKLALTNGDFWFETRVATSTITDTKHNFLLGLIENTAFTATVPITAAGAIADKNMVGFFRGEAASGGAVLYASYKADGQTAVSTAAATLAVDTYVNLGMKFVPKRNIGAGPGYFYWYVNGVVVHSYLVTSTAGNPFPNDTNMGFFFAVLNATGTTPGNSTCKYVRMAQLAAPLP